MARPEVELQIKLVTVDIPGEAPQKRVEPLIPNPIPGRIKEKPQTQPLRVEPEKVPTVEPILVPAGR